MVFYPFEMYMDEYSNIHLLFFHMKEIVKNKFDNHLLFSYVIVIITCSLRWFLCMNFFTLLFLVKTIQKNFYKINILRFLHLRLVLLFLTNLIENYKIKYLPWGLNPEIHNRNGFLKIEKIFAVTGD